MVQRIRYIATHSTRIFSLRDLTAVRSERGSRWREGQPRQPNSPEGVCCASGDPDGQSTALQVSGGDGYLEGVGSEIKSIDENSDDWRVALREGGVDVSVGECAVA